jgi:hypothetical protein
MERTVGERGGRGGHYRFQDFWDGEDLRDYNGSNGVTEDVGVQVAEVGDIQQKIEKVQSRQMPLRVSKLRRTLCVFLLVFILVIVNTGEAEASYATLTFYFHFGM